MVIGTGRLVHNIRAPHVLINTTALIHGVGLVLQGYKIEAVRPDAIVAIQKANELESVLRAHRNHDIFRIPLSEKSSAKTPEARKEAREKAFARYFESSTELCLELPKIVFQRTLLFSGKSTAGAGQFLHLDKTSEGLVAVGKSREREEEETQDSNIRILPPDFEENLLCGLADSTDRGIGLAIVKHIDFAARTIHLITPVTASSIRILQPGDISITREGRELNRKWPGPI